MVTANLKGGVERDPVFCRGAKELKASLGGILAVNKVRKCQQKNYVLGLC